MQDNEIFELCKEVYEKTGWKTEHVGDKELYLEKCYWNYRDKLQDSVVDRYKILEEQFVCPVYTSDYLLEKLPYYINTHDVRGTFEFFLKKTYNEYHAGYNKPELGKWLDDNNHAVWEKVMHADTPLKALLKLTLALHDAGVKL